jgi:hypothetical protein
VQITCALLCDAATLREGMLHILGGGATRLGRPRFPAPMFVTLALMTLQEREEALRGHVVEIVIVGSDDEVVYRSETAIPAPSLAHVAEGEQVAVPLIVPLSDVLLPQPGIYRLLVVSDSEQGAMLAFHAHDNSATQPRGRVRNPRRA